EPAARFGAAEGGLRLGIADEIGDLIFAVGGVERQIDESGAQATEIEEDVVRRLVDLDRDPVSGRQPKSQKEIRVACGLRLQVRIGVAAFGFQLQADLVYGTAEALRAKGVKVHPRILRDGGATGSPVSAP